MADTKLENVRVDPDPDAETEGLDRGDELKEGDEGIDLEKLGRDNKGRFVPKDEKPEKEEEKEEEPVKDAGKKKPAKKEKEEEPEEEEETEEDVEEDTEEEPEEEETPEKKPGKTVPYNRFQEVVTQRNSLADKLAQTDASTRKAASADTARIAEINKAIEAMYEDVEKARADGETKEAARIQRQIDQGNREINRIENALTARVEAFQATESMQYNNMLDVLEARYPRMNPNDPEFDRATVVALEELVRGYELQGIPLSTALRKATMLVFQEDAFKGVVAVKEEEKAEKKPAPTKKKTDIEKNAKAAKGNGLEVDETNKGRDLAKIVPSELSEEDFDKLPESKQRELRGDFFGG